MGKAELICSRQDRNGMLRRALERQIQLYTDKSHFVYELLQNAEDSEATSIKFIQFSDRLEVLHDGKPFTDNNLQGLCDIGMSDKTKNLNQIGEFGVGFKSVFGICEKVRLYSVPDNYRKSMTEKCDEFAVEIHDFVRPIDIPMIDIEDGYTTKFIFPYAVGLSFSGFRTINELNQAISKRLKNLGITTLLFMKNLELIEYEISLDNEKKCGSYLLQKDEINDHCTMISALGESDKSEEDISYLKFTRNIDSIQSNRTVEIAFPLKITEDGYDFQISNHPHISVYFPTETESKLDFIVQGPYRTTPNRSSVPSDDRDNIRLAKETAELLKLCITELRDCGKLNLSFLRILPIDESRFYHYDLFSPLYDATKALFKKEAILPLKNGKYGTSKQVKIARSKELTELFSDSLLTSLIDGNRAYYWLPTVLTESNKQFKSLYGYLTYDLDIEVIKPEELRSYFNQNSKFLKSRNDDWLIKLYTFLESIKSEFSKSRYGSNMLTVNFVKTESGKIVAPFRKNDHGNYLPNIFIPIKDFDKSIKIEFVNKNIYAKCRNFFDNILQLQKPNEEEYFLESIKNRYANGYKADDEKHIDDLKMILKYLRNPDYEGEMIKLINSIFLVRCQKDGYPYYKNTYQTSVYFEKTCDGISIKGYYHNIKDQCYIDLDFYQNYGITYDDLKLLGVKDSITFKNLLTSSIHKLLNVVYYISTHPNKKDSILKSQAIFKTLQLLEKANELYRYLDSIHILTSYPHTFYKNNGKCKWDGRWLFSESQELVSAESISKHNLNKNIYGKVLLDSSLYEKLKFKKDKVDQLEDVIKKLDNSDLSEADIDLVFESVLQQKYGISLNEFENTLPTSPYSNDEECFEFPSSKVKNWEALKKHVAEMMYFASPVEYEYVVRRIRTSSPDASVKAYLMNMYRIHNTYEYACQMCHTNCESIEKCQIEINPKNELAPMNICVCPNCATKFRAYRNDEYRYNKFISAIKKLTRMDIESSDPVVIKIGSHEVWFSQTHIAEICELLKLKEPATVNVTYEEDDYIEVKNNSSNVISFYIGKKVYLKRQKTTGNITNCKVNGNETLITIKFIDGIRVGEEKDYSLDMCIKNKLIEFLDT